jgi:translation initiation factor 1A
MVEEQEEILRIRIPKEGEVLGVAIAMLGAGRISVKCKDGVTRICRIPGKMRRRVWIRIGYLVIIQPWKVQPKEKGDIIWVYTKTQADWLRRKGYAKNLSVE